MTTPDDLEPGIYLVGRDDGTVQPFFVKVVIDGPSKQIHHHPDVSFHVDQAREYSGWWWEKMTVGRLPSDKELREMGPMYGQGGR